jgi:hypothetical protein
MRDPIWHLRNGFWRWWYGGPRWSRWSIIGAGLGIGSVLAAGWPRYWGLLSS